MSPVETILLYEHGLIEFFQLIVNMCLAMLGTGAVLLFGPKLNGLRKGNQ